MTITDPEAGTNVHEISDRIYRINTPVRNVPGGFSFNQYLVIDDEPLLFHTGPRRLFPLVHEAVRTVIGPRMLKYVAFSHFEADECGALNEWLAAAPNAVPVCGAIAAMVSVTDVADRAPRALSDGERLKIGDRTMRWFDAPHLPHGWDCGFLFEEKTKTLFCGDLFTQGGAEQPPLTQADILGPSEAFRKPLDYFAHAPNSGALLEKLASLSPRTLACMHGSAWSGDGAGLLRALAAAIASA
ncbi:MAG: FprA family A-type flavoprotein [Parvularculaceae bacterium]